MTASFRTLASRSLLALALSTALAPIFCLPAACFAQEEGGSEQKEGEEKGETKLIWASEREAEVVQGVNIIGTEVDPKKTYMMFAFSTQAPGAFAHLSNVASLQRRFKEDGLVPIGISNDSASRIRQFLSGKAGISDLTILRANATELDAIKRLGLPNSMIPVYLMQKGRIVWSGSVVDPSFPLNLALVLSGRYDPEISAKGQPLYAAALDAIKLKNYRDAYRHFDAMIAIDQRVFGEAAILKYVSMIRDAKDNAGARKWGEEILTKYADDNFTLVQLATTIMTSDDIKDRDAELAMKTVDALASRLSDTSPRVLRLRASILAALGRFSEAQELQYQAWMAAEPADKADNKRLLDAYRRKAKTVKNKAPTPAGDAASGESKPEDAGGSTEGASTGGASTGEPASETPRGGRA